MVIKNLIKIVPIKTMILALKVQILWKLSHQ